jgi:hypothetical protein
MKCRLANGQLTLRELERDDDDDDGGGGDH